MDIFLEGLNAEQREKVERYKILNQFAEKGQILFVGSSLMEQFPINELAMNHRMSKIIYNRGVGGYKTDDLMQVMDTCIFDLEPTKIFINIGTNDIGAENYKLEVMIEKYQTILTEIKSRLPETQVFTMAYYPVNDVDELSNAPWAKDMFVTRTNENIKLANQAVEQLAHKLGFNYIDVNEGLTDGRGKLKREFTIEGLHMYGNGYEVVLKNMMKYL
jgi:lysophospholipase L1-like esterase